MCFRNPRTHTFQSTFQCMYDIDTNGIDKIKQCPDILVFANKTSNIYKMNTKNCQKLLKENITVTYKKAPVNLEKVINSEAKSITKKRELSDRKDYLARSPAYITLKDHEENFLLKPTCWLRSVNEWHAIALARTHIHQYLFRCTIIACAKLYMTC